MSASYFKTLRYWLDVEALMYPDIPKPGKRRHYTLRYADTLPWQQIGTSTSVPDHKYFVYLGLVQQSILEAELWELFRTSPETNPGGTHERKKTGKTFLCAIEVTAGGAPVVDTLQLAAFAIAFAGRKFETVLSSALILKALKEHITNLQSDSESNIADAAWFEQVTNFLIAELSWQPKELMASAQVCAHRVPLTNSKGKPLSQTPEMDPINSFYVDDLVTISAGAERGPGSAQVKAYLEGERKTHSRIDVTQLDVVNTRLAPHRFPMGRWPSRFPLFLMQQVAVNTALEELSDGGIFSVNGPPGTGKTTLLMDVIAARIVERAMVLAEFDSPERAFTKSPSVITYPANKDGKINSGPCFFMDERLLDCGIVVASANNKAVENITQDLPNLEKVFPQPLSLDGEDFNYFASTAEAILNPEAGKKVDVGPGDDETSLDDEEPKELEGIRCWGLVSAALGKKSNRSRVANQLGFFADTGIQKMLSQIEPSRLDWESSRRRFQLALSRVSDIQNAIQKFDKAIPALTSLYGKLAVARAAVQAADGEHEKGKLELAMLGAQAKLNEDELAGNLAERNQYSQDWSWWRLLLARLFQSALYTETCIRRQELESEYSELRSSRANLKRSIASKSADVAGHLAQLHVAQSAVSSYEKDIVRIEAELATLRTELGSAAFVPADFAALSPDKQQKSLPRSNDAYHEARANVFVAAMALQQSFIKHAGKSFETNFRLALSMLTGDKYIQNNLPTMARHLWATFFLTVPVVSSTFASVSRCFKDLGEGEIGLLLVDEAGQAVPSHALGAIWRSKRVLIVGDPLQVEPVLNMDVKLDYEILKYHGAPEEHLLTRYSAQHLADRANQYGAHLTQYDGSDLWVGSPLRVHRRCVDPMFSISNRIAYNGKMVFGPNPDDEILATGVRSLLGPSRWIDVVADDFQEHYSAAEGKVVFDMVAEFKRKGYCNSKDKLPELYVISPFKSVATEITALLSEHSDRWAAGIDEEVISTWIKSHVGTVHTFQGKECESVIFILGGKSAGAREWAGSRPNIINVAITRAKRRLYVVGNKKAWSSTTFGAALSTI